MIGHRLLRSVAVSVAVTGTAAAAVLPAPTGEPAIVIHSAGHSTQPPPPGRAGSVFMLAIGNDYRPGVEGHRADALHLIGVNLDDGSGTVLNIPRDTWVAIPGRGVNKINSANTFGGPALQAATVEALTGIRPEFIVMTDFAGFQAMVDGIGGIDVDVPVPMADANSGAFFSPGRQRLDGPAALAFSRNRHVTGGDFARSAHQGQLLVSALAQLRAGDTGPSALARYVDLLLGHTELHGMSPADLYRLARAVLAIDPARIRSLTMPGTIGTAGGQSVVLVAPAAGALFADMADDAVVQSAA